MATRVWYEVRIREYLGEGKYVKKSKFYRAKSPREAAGIYDGKGYIMGVEKVGMEKLLGIGEFFRLGGDLLEDLRLPKLEDGKDTRRQKRNYYKIRRK